MKTIKTIIIWKDETKGLKISEDINLLCKNEVVLAEYDEEMNVENLQFDILIIDFSQNKIKIESDAFDFIKKIKNGNQNIVIMVAGKYPSSFKTKLNEFIDIFSGVTINKIKNDFRLCIDLVITRKYKMNYFLTDFFAPHLVGALERKGFELVLNETYDRETYKNDFLHLWKSFITVSPLLKQKNREMLKAALYNYEERDLYPEEKEAINNEFFFQFISLPALGNFSDRRLYYMEKSVIESVFLFTVEYARDIDNSILFGCHKEGNIVRLKVTTHKPFNLKKITKSSKIFKTLSMIEPYGDVVITSNEQRLVIGNDPETDYINKEELPYDEDTLTFMFYIKVITPYRRHRGLKRY